MNALLAMTMLVPVAADVETAAVETPYQVAVCLRLEDDPLLTPQFAEQVRRQVRDQLRNFLGPLASVSVMTSEHWLIDDYVHEDVTLPTLDGEIMESREMSGQTFLFRIGFQRRQYRVRWRTVDAVTGNVGKVRQQETPDRQWVVKTICRAVRGGFAVRANIAPGRKDGEAKVTFVGEEHRNYLNRVLGDQCFMQLYWVANRRAGVARTLVPKTLILWERSKGTHVARVVSTYGSAWSRKAGIEYQAVRLQTQPGRLRLQLVDQERSTPINSGLVSANDTGFGTLTERDILPRSGRDGVVLSPKVLQHIAYVRVHTGGTSMINVPLPIVADVSDHVLPVVIDRSTLAKNDFVRDLRFLNQDLQTIQSIISAANQTTNDFNARKRYEDASKSVESAVAAVSPSLAAAKAELLELEQEADRLQIKNRQPLDYAAQKLDELTTRQRELTDIHETIQGAIDSRDASQRASVLVKLGEQAERDADFEEAITRYELALAEYSDQPQLAERLRDLKEEWRIKSPEHEEARRVVLDRWVSAELTDVEDLLADVETAFDTLKRVGDTLTARRLLLANTQHTLALSDLVQQLAGRSSDEDRAEAEKYKELSERMAGFAETVASFVTGSGGDHPPKVNDPVKAPPTQPPSKGASSLLDLEDDEEAPE